jgi:hypothetical protein
MCDRQVQKFDLFNCNWYDIGCNSIEEGDVFRMFEPNGKRVIDTDGVRVFIAASDAYRRKSDGEWIVECRPFKVKEGYDSL